MAERIESKHNNKIKLCMKLQRKKYRDKFNLYIVEGPNLIQEAILNGVTLEFVIYNESQEVDLPKVECPVLATSAEIFQEIADTVNSQGVIGVVCKEDKTYEDIKPQITPEGNIVILDKVQDPGNVGTIIRTADAAGYQCVVMIKGSCDVYSPKVVRSATGSLFRIPIIYVDYDEYEKLSNEIKKKTVVTTLDSEYMYFQEDLTKGIALVIGNEGNGVSREMRDMADVAVKIPMKGNIESLNASVAAAIIMAESIRK